MGRGSEAEMDVADLNRALLARQMLDNAGASVLPRRWSTWLAFRRSLA